MYYLSMNSSSEPSASWDSEDVSGWNVHQLCFSSVSTISVSHESPQSDQSLPCMLLSFRGRYKWSFASSWAHGMISMGPSRSCAVCNPQYPHRWALEADIATRGQYGEREPYAARFQSEWASSNRELLLLLIIPRGLPYDQAWMCELHSEKGRYVFPRELRKWHS